MYHKILKENWGYDDFRPLQLDIIESIGAGIDTLAILPTGGGKSITYQVPALAMEGMALIISPLIALMTDQIQNLKKRGIRAEVIHAGMNRDRVFNILEQAQYGAFKMLYVAPERLQSELFLKRLQFLQLSLIAVDEAHCISEWGYDFRPSYLKIADLREMYPDVPILALTASATPDVVSDIREKLLFRTPSNMFQASVERNNLHYVVRMSDNKDAQLYKILIAVQGSAIVYTRTRDGAEKVAKMLQSMDLSANYYHAGLESNERRERQNSWMSGETRILCATNAFGMGIDKADVRLVVHYDIPDALEQYYQEAGRAGRDGLKSYAVLLTTSSSVEQLVRRHEKVFPPKEYVRAVYQHLANYYVIGEGSGNGSVYPFKLEEFCHICRLSYSLTMGALNILQWAGYITLTEEMESPSKLKVVMHPSKLYEWRMEHPEKDHILETILRNYTGLFTDAKHINEDRIAIIAHSSREEVYAYLIWLHRVGVVQYVPFKRTPLLIYNTDRQDAEALYIPPVAYEKRIDRMYARLVSMYEYSTKEKCRSVLLAEYFGQKDAQPCGKCDYCLERKKKI